MAARPRSRSWNTAMARIGRCAIRWNPGAVLDGRGIFVWHRGGGPLLDVTGGENSRVVFTVAKDRIPLASLTDLQDSPLLVSTILGFRSSERAVFRYIVLIPLGAFVVVLMRNIIGVPTLGTFMPVLHRAGPAGNPAGAGSCRCFRVLIAAGLWFRFLLVPAQSAGRATGGRLCGDRHPADDAHERRLATGWA